MYTFFIILIVGIVLGIAFGLFSKKGEGKSVEQKILDFIHEHGTVTSKDVQEMLGVPEPEATKHLQELEDKKHIIQNETTEPYKIYEARRR